MKYTTSLLLAVGAVVSAEHVILEPFAQCGGLSYYGAWECPKGYDCSANDASSAFPNYMCVLPGTHPSIAFPYGQCGGQGFTGPTTCSAGWSCVVQNAFFSTCTIKPGVTTPASPDPGLAGPGNFCGVSAVERGSPAVCVPGFMCAGPGVFDFWVCVPKPTVSTTTAVHTTTTLVTTAKPTMTAKTTTAKTTTKTTTTTTKASTTKTTTTRKATSTYHA